MGLRPLERGVLHSLVRWPYSRKMLARLEVVVLEVV